MTIYIHTLMNFLNLYFRLVLVLATLTNQKISNGPNILNIKTSTNRSNRFTSRKKKVPQRMANKVWKYLKQLSINLIARIMNFSEVGWPQGLLALEFCLLAYINYILKTSLKIRSSQSSNIPEFPMINQKSKIIRNKCGRDILLYVNYRSTLDLIIWIFRDIWQKNM